MKESKEGCREVCSGGKNLTTCDYTLGSDDLSSWVKLTIRILQLDDMIWDMISPGEHSVCVRWLDNDEKNTAENCEKDFVTKYIDDCEEDCNNQDCNNIET